MSLQSLRAMRMKRCKPGAVIVWVGPVHRVFAEAPDVVAIAPDARPAALDLRPLVDLRTFVIQIHPDEKHFSDVLLALQKAGAEVDGFITGSNEVAAACPEHEAPMKRVKELMWPR